MRHFLCQGLRSRPPFTGVVRGPGRKVPHGVLLECFWAPGSGCPKECLSSAFWHVWGSKSSKKHSLGHSEPGAQKHSKSTPWGTFLALDHSCKWRTGSQAEGLHSPLMCSVLGMGVWVCEVRFDKLGPNVLRCPRCLTSPLLEWTLG